MNFELLKQGLEWSCRPRQSLFFVFDIPKNVRYVVLPEWGL